MHSVLEIHSLMVSLHIGNSPKEKLTPQEVAIDITIGFTSPPLEEQTDELKHSVCYSKICTAVRELTAQKSFSLIEKLCFEILTQVKKLLPPETHARVRVHKINPPVKNLKGGVSYTCGDSF